MTAVTMAAWEALLTASEAFSCPSLTAEREALHALGEGLRARAIALIEASLAIPVDPHDRLVQLRHAVDLAGADAPLVARVALALATDRTGLAIPQAA